MRDIRRVCGLGALLTAEELDKYWIDTDPARTPNSSLRKRIRLTLEDENDVRILVHGHGGSGKLKTVTLLEAPFELSIRGWNMRELFVHSSP